MLLRSTPHTPLGGGGLIEHDILDTAHFGCEFFREGWVFGGVGFDERKEMKICLDRRVVI